MYRNFESITLTRIIIRIYSLNSTLYRLQRKKDTSIGRYISTSRSSKDTENRLSEETSGHDISCNSMESFKVLSGTYNTKYRVHNVYNIINKI